MALMQPVRLPRKIEEDPGAEGLVDALVQRARPLLAGGEALAPQFELTAALEAALRSALSQDQIVRGIEAAEHSLATEERGLKRVDRTTGVARGKRVSRLLVLADDGAEKFYREVENMVRRYAPRVLALRLSTDGLGLGQPFFGPHQVERLLLAEHKDAVSAVLLALASQWSEAGESDPS
jgi:hypothetical protein